MARSQVGSFGTAIAAATYATAANVAVAAYVTATVAVSATATLPTSGSPGWELYNHHLTLDLTATSGFRVFGGAVELNMLSDAGYEHLGALQVPVLGLGRWYGCVVLKLDWRVGTSRYDPGCHRHKTSQGMGFGGVEASSRFSSRNEVFVLGACINDCNPTVVSPRVHSFSL